MLKISRSLLAPRPARYSDILSSTISGLFVKCYHAVCPEHTARESTAFPGCGPMSPENMMFHGLHEWRIWTRKMLLNAQALGNQESGYQERGSSELDSL